MGCGFEVGSRLLQQRPDMMMEYDPRYHQHTEVPMACCFTFRSHLVAVIGALTVASSVSAMFAPPSAVPIDRIIQNVEARLQENPNDVDALYTLARANYLAFVNKSANIPVVGGLDDGEDEGGGERRARRGGGGGRGGVQLAPRWMTEPDPSGRGGSTMFTFALLQEHARQLTLSEFAFANMQSIPEASQQRFYEALNRKTEELRQQDWRPAGLDDAKLLEHAQKALDGFSTLIGLRPDNALDHLGVASFYQQYAEWRTEKKLANEKPALKAITLEMALASYHKAYSLAIAADRRLQAQPIAGLMDIVSYEAGKRYIELAKKLWQTPTAEQAAKLKEVTDGVAALDRLPIRVMTPIVLSPPRFGEKTATRVQLGDLIDSAARVRFDLDGDDRVEAWSWVKPTTGILVWDPARTGRIASGRQLFGNVTWWLLFADGYRALDTLDNDRDGYVSGSELAGLAVWFDRNTNGLSERGEVAPIEQAFDGRIRSLGTRPDGEELGGPFHSRGLILDDGQALPTYDWIAERVEE
jgi:hypothetical protein